MNLHNLNLTNFKTYIISYKCFYKTKLCEKINCNDSESCYSAHSINEIRKPICISFGLGKCKNNNCNFEHRDLPQISQNIYDLILNKFIDLEHHINFTTQNINKKRKIYVSSHLSNDIMRDRIKIKMIEINNQINKIKERIKLQNIEPKINKYYCNNTVYNSEYNDIKYDLNYYNLNFEDNII